MRSRHSNTANAAVVIFRPNVAAERAQAILDMLRDKGWIEAVQVQTYNPDHGTPVFYIP